MVAAAPLGMIARNRTRRRRRCRERAEAIKHARRRHDLRCTVASFRFAASAATLRGCARSGEGYKASQHVHERTRERQIGPARVGRHMEKHDQALAAAFRRDQGRTICKRCPGAVGKK